MAIQPPALPMEALRAAFMAVLTKVAAQRPLGGLTMDRLVLILRVGCASPAPRRAAIDCRSRPAMAALATHMGVEVDDSVARPGGVAVQHDHRQRLRRLVVDDPDIDERSETILAKLQEALGHVAEMTAELRLL